ncbi:hypothetical protein F5148DRAFT_1220268 [Russula earlei]|uniref:Uncharacterized protein n=1 Tax=Russula earlei TaxID=71964 RepID=A0ACC0U1V2_9AGAM|nr:hypothetical protein F5148DRAFT_1220268 [Russula earlei]
MDVDPSPKRARDEFRSVKASIVLAVPPVFANRLRCGAEEMLDTMIMRYEPALNGVVLAHSDVHFLNRVARLQADSPFAICRVGFEALVWNPTIGMKLTGRVALCSPDHVSLLVHRTFNVSIPRHHIPTDQWEFEYGPAENDPEYGNVDDDMDAYATADAKGDDAQPPDHRGRWVHKVTGDRLGGKDRWLQFTVVGLTVANQMLSLIGSVQPNPFSPDHISQTKLDREQRQPSPRPVAESEASDGEEPDAFTVEPSSAGDERGQRRKEKERRGKGETLMPRGKEEKAKRKRKGANDVPKSEHKPKRRKAS